jgi:hypothetical protein
LATIKRARTYLPSDKTLADAQSSIEKGNSPATPPSDVVATAG